MAIKRYTASADNTIVNAFKSNLRTRATGSNAGAADVVEVFSIYARQATGSTELSRVLMKFPVDSITSDRNASTLPASGSVSFYLRLFNAPHAKTTPQDFELMVLPVSSSWQEGHGLDLESYKDETKGNIGSNWMSASNSAAWNTVGGDFLTGSDIPIFSQSFSTGLEDIEIDITSLVENWVDGTIDNYGVGIHLSSSYEGYYSSSLGVGVPTGSILDNRSGATESYYTKRFFARGTQYFFLKPTIEARWDSRRNDDRGDAQYSSSLANTEDNLNTLYLYNYVRGALADIPSASTGSIYVSLYSGSANNSAPSGSALRLPTTLPHSNVGTNNQYVVTGGWVETGMYTASFAITAAMTPINTVFDVWHDGTGDAGSTGALVSDNSVQFSTSSFKPASLVSAQTTKRPTYYLNITNLQDKYRSDETARLDLFVRNKNWSPTIYTVATNKVESTTIHSASYRVFRLLDAYEAIPYGTGSEMSTALSYDVSGSYFDFDMSLLEAGYAYAFKFSFCDSSRKSWIEQQEMFKFRVEEYEY